MCMVLQMADIYRLIAEIYCIYIYMVLTKQISLVLFTIIAVDWVIWLLLKFCNEIRIKSLVQHGVGTSC